MALSEGLLFLHHLGRFSVIEVSMRYIFFAFLLVVNSAGSWTTTSSVLTHQSRSKSQGRILMSFTHDGDDKVESFVVPHQEVRRNALQRIFRMMMATVTVGTVAATTAPALAADVAEESADGVFTRETKQFGYTVKSPSTYKQTAKPVKTHLDEINFISESIKSCQFGITIDPVRINSLKEVRW